MARRRKDLKSTIILAITRKIQQAGGKIRRGPPEGEKIDRLRMQKEETTHLVVSGWSRCRAFSTGYKITVQGGEAAGSTC